MHEESQGAGVELGSVCSVGTATTACTEETKAEQMPPKPQPAEIPVTRFRGRLIAPLNLQKRGRSQSEWTDGFWASAYFGLYELADWEVYRAALIEFFGTLAFFCIHITAITTTTQGGYDHPALAVATVKGITLSLLIFAFANTSGGHFNPVITLSTMFTRLTPAARGVLYMIAQTLGAMVAAWIFRDIERSNDIQLNFGLCTNELNGWSAMAIEALFDIIMLYTAFGSAFDKQQAQLYGPIAGSIMIGFNLTILLWVTSGLNQHGFVWGANPAFCMAAAAGRAYWKDTWVSWAGALVSCAVNALLYVYIPPNHKAVYEERRSLASKQSRVVN